MSKSLLYFSLSFIFLILFNEFNNYIFVYFFILFYLFLLKRSKKIFLLYNVIIIFEILLSFPSLFSFSKNFYFQNILLNRVVDVKVKSFIDLALFNNKNSNIYNLSLELSISYLIIISGMHINMIFKLVSSFLSLLIDEKLSSLVSIVIISMYVFVLGFPISSLRSVLMLIIGVFFKKINKFDRYFIVLIIVLIISPYNLFELSFIYSFLITFIILCISNSLPKNNLKKTLLISIISFLVSIPININLNYEINVLQVLYSFVFTYPFIISIILSFITLVVPALSLFMNVYITMLEKLLSLFSKYRILIPVIEMTILDYFIYYLIFIILIIMINKFNKKRWICFVSIFIFSFSLFLKDNVSNIYEVIFIDVNQGDSILFRNKYSKKGYLVDTGGNKNYDVATKILIPLLDRLNIDEIECVVITHNDYDHNGALESLENNFKVNEVLYEVDIISFFGFNFMNINSNTYDNDNDNSIVLYGNYAGIDLLLTGDISSYVERVLIDDYPNLSVDILKIAHHGSKYSTSEIFLRTYRPKIAILSYGYNHYGHPSKEVLFRLNELNVNVYSTYEQGHLIFSCNKQKIYLRTIK